MNTGQENIGMYPRLAPTYRLQWEPVQQCYVLLYPEGMVKLNTSAAEILKRCDGTRTLLELVRELEIAFSAQNLEGEIRTFITSAVGRRWLLES